MDRRKIETFTVSLAVLLLAIMTTVGIIGFADTFFDWNLFPPNIEKILWFLMVSGLILIVSSALVNIMINLSIIAISAQELLANHKKKHDSK